ncbi:MAG: cupin domain-containing protein, partial [Candidatus Omnitrophota bacterium]
LTDLYAEVLAKNAVEDSRAGTQKAETFFHSSGAVAELLTCGIFNKKMMPVLLKVKPGGRTEVEEYSAGSERFVYVLRGRLQLMLEKESKTLNREQSAYFGADRPHFFKNTGSGESLCLSVLTPVAP